MALGSTRKDGPGRKLGVMFLALLLICLGTNAQVNVQNLLTCTDCVATPVLGGGSYSSRPVITLWQLTYGLLQPDVQFSYASGNNSVTYSLSQLLFPCKTTFAYDYALQPSPASVTDPAYADIISVPYFYESMAIVYNLPGLQPTDPPLNLTRRHLNLIYQQIITSWNDTTIQAINPRAVAVGALQNLSMILVFRQDATGVTQTLLSALSKIDPGNWSGAEVQLTWPPDKLFNHTAEIIAKDQFSAASFVLTTPGAIGYAPISICNDAGLLTAKIYNRAGSLVSSNTASLLAAVSSLDWTNSSAPKQPTDAPGAASYPFVTVTWLLFHKTTQDCGTYSAMFRFFYWCLTNSYASALIGGLPGFISLDSPAAAYTLSVLDKFQCEGSTLLAANYVDADLSILRQIMICVSGIFIMLTLSILGTLGYKRNSRITKAAGLAFALCFLVGCLLNYISVFFWAVSPSMNIFCRARYAFVMLGYSLILGAMFSKSWEVNKVFTAGETGVANPFHEVPWWQFCRVFFAIVAIQGGLLLILMASDPPFSVSVTLDAINFQSVHECQVKNQNVWIGLEAVYFVLLLVWGAYLAYETRDVWLKYNYPNESRSILLSIYNLAFCCIILVPLITTLEVSYETSFFLVAIAILWPTSFALSSVYMPKLAKFLGSSFRGSGGNNSKGSVGSTGSTASVASNVKTLMESGGGAEKKLLSNERERERERDRERERERANSRRKSKENGDVEIVLSMTPEPESPHRTLERNVDSSHADFSPSQRRGIDRTESAEMEGSAPNWRGLLSQSPSTGDFNDSPENTKTSTTTSSP